MLFNSMLVRDCIASMAFGPCIAKSEYFSDSSFIETPYLFLELIQFKSFSILLAFTTSKYFSSLNL